MLSTLLSLLFFAVGPQTIAYGSDPDQTLHFTPSSQPGVARGLVVFVHGGGWSRGSKENATGRWKANHLTKQGFAFATVDYRLVPRVWVEDQAMDVAAAIAKLRRDAKALGYDSTRIALMGHSAGAHLSALVGTDPSYLKSQGQDLTVLAGVVLIDGAAYDVPRQMRDAGRFMASRYDQAFGRDTARQRQLSPIFHAPAPNAPRFLILHIDRDDGTSQSKELSDALSQAGTAVQRQGFPDRGLLGHMHINRKLGDPDHPATNVVDTWISQIQQLPSSH